MPLHSNDPIYTTHGAIRFYDHEVDWIDGVAEYKDAPAYDPRTFEMTPHRFPHGLPEGCTLHYADGYNGQPVICDNQNGVAYGLYVLD